jgi:LysR family transcriptional regulator, transcriptional activator of nhaA
MIHNLNMYKSLPTPELLSPDLIAFMETVRCGTASAAARTLHISQPALSSRLARLAKALGLELFKRQGRKLQLTAAGTRVYESGLRVLRSCDALQAAIRSQAGIESRLRVGASDSVPKVIVRRVLAPYLRAGLQIECREWRTDHLERELSEHRLDMLISDRAPVNIQDEELETIVQGRSTITFCARKDQAGKLRANFPECLNSMPLGLPARPSVLREKIDRWLAHHAPKTQVVLEAEDRALLHQVAAAGLIIAPVAKTVSRTVTRQYGLATIAELGGVSESYYCIRAKGRVPSLL